MDLGIHFMTKYFCVGFFHGPLKIIYFYFFIVASIFKTLSKINSMKTGPCTKDLEFIIREEKRGRREGGNGDMENSVVK